jgi:hypothetical protein
MPLSFDEYYPGGPNPNFTLYHIWKCYDFLDKNGPLGRRGLAKLLNLGEGSTRTLLDKMMHEGCIEYTKVGALLTPRGHDKLREPGISIVPFDFLSILPSKFTCAVLVKGKARGVVNGCEQRDEAVRAGAEAAIILVAGEGKVVFPQDERFPDQQIIESMRAVCPVQDGDAMIIAGASSYDAAERGAVTAALALATETKGCWSEGTSLFTSDSEEEDVKCIALAIHELVGRLPVTMRTKNHYGVRCEDGQIKESNFTGPVLEETLKRGKIVRRHSKAGKYRGVPVLAVPFIRNKETIAVVGVFDVTKGSYAEWLGKTRKKS